VSKCELIAHKHFQVHDALLQSFRRVEFGDATLLSAPLFLGAALDTAWDDRCKDLARAIERLKSIGSQDALILLRSSFSALRVLHLLRCSPSADHPLLNKFDVFLRDSVQQITNSDFSDMKWIQASLRVRDGSLGLDV